MSRHGNMHKVGQTGYLGSNENIYLRTAGFRGMTTPAISTSVVAPMAEMGKLWWPGLDYLPIRRGWEKWDVQPGKESSGDS